MSAETSTTEPRWRRLPEERPRQILAAALEVFGEHGLAAARLDDIAKRAGLSKGTIYLYFPNKEELFREMIRHLVVTPLEGAQRGLESGNQSATESLTTFAREYWAFMRSAQFSPLFRLIHAEIRNFPDLARFYNEEVIARGHGLLASIIERGQAAGEFRPMNSRVAARMLMAPLVMHGVWCGHRECFGPVAGIGDAQVLDEILQFFLSAIRPPESAPRNQSTT